MANYENLDTAPRILCLDKGYVALVETMGREDTPAIRARSSFATKERKTHEQNRRLTKYLLKHHHSTPFEFCEACYYMKMPIFVARQIVRHRTASVNEISLRYVKATEDMYVPALDRMQRQSENNKQGSSDLLIDAPQRAADCIKYAYGESLTSYRALLDMELSNELARTVLPLGNYTEWYWKCDIRNILHFMALRRDPHAQYETRVYAQAMLDLVRPEFPMIFDAWEELMNEASTERRDLIMSVIDLVVAEGIELHGELLENILALA